MSAVYSDTPQISQNSINAEENTEKDLSPAASMINQEKNDPGRTKKTKSKRGRKKKKTTKKDLNQNELTPEQVATEKRKAAKRAARPHFVQGAIRKIVKDIQPDYTVSKKCAQVCSDLAIDFMEQLTREENSLLNFTTKRNNKSGNLLTGRHMETAFKLRATGEIVNHGISEARKAIENYKEWQAPQLTESEQNENKKKKTSTWRKKCGLVIDPIWCRKYAKQHSKAKIITKENSIAKAAVVEYMLAEILELASNHLSEVTKNKVKRIQPRNIQMAILNDDELHRMFRNVHIAEGGVASYIHRNLLHNNVKPKDMVAAVEL